jgi:hypothetical protein
MVPSFLAAGIIGYFGAFLGGQIYGIPYDALFALTYDTKDSIVPYKNAVFPLPLVYMVVLALILFYLFKITKK